MLLPQNFYWTHIINLIIQKYLNETTICILWNSDIEFNLASLTYTHNNVASFYAFVSIDRNNLQQSLDADIVDYAIKRKEMLSNGIILNDLIEKLTMSIEKSHCESFLAFQDDIPIFVEAFSAACKYSIWRSKRNKFLFVYSAAKAKEHYFQHKFFRDQANILIIEADNSKGDGNFNLKTNKFVGSLAENPESLYLLDRYDAKVHRFQRNQNLYPDKISNLQGREVIIAAYEYKPFLVLKYDSYKNVRDVSYAAGDEKALAYLDGTEARILITFCEKYNCSIEIDTSEAYDWGVMYANFSGDGALGMVAKQKAEITMGAMYSWQEIYTYLDMSMYLVRSGITCLVPAPRRLTSWSLPLDPFQSTLWAAVVACLLIEVLSLLLMRHSQQLLHQTDADDNSWHKSFYFGVITTLKLCVSQSGSESIRSMSLRVLLFACFLNDLIITSIYGGGLASILTIPSFGEAADSLERLQTHQLKWAANSEAWVSTIRDTDDPRMNNILKNFWIYSDDALRKMALENYMGFTIERLPFGHYAIEDYLTLAAIDRMKIMIDDIYFQYTVAFTTRLWPMLSRFDELTYMWHSSGFGKYWEWRVVADNLNTHIQKEVEASLFENFDDMGPVELGMSNFAGILLVWILGISVATLVFVAELILYHSKQRIRTVVL